MSQLETAFPTIGRLANKLIPLSRDQVVLLMAAINAIFLAIDIYLAHSISGTIVFREWVPIVFGFIGGGVLLLSGLVSLKWRMSASVVAFVVLAISLFIGLAGAYFHVLRGSLPYAPAGQQITVQLLVWAPPILGPLTFSLVGLLGISALFPEEPAHSALLQLPRGRAIRMPMSKSQFFYLLIALGILATLLSSTLDHARTDFENPWLWIAASFGVLGTVVAVSLGIIAEPRRSDLVIYATCMMLLILLGVVGAALHIGENLTAGNQFVQERFIRGAPFLAPLLYSNMGAIGLIVMLDPRSARQRESV